ncbi:MAG TPA: hypothetical protein VHY22_19100 [Chthoniobacteraceae bacterium]|jgi:hypothetical protein|nr:hypothetical protein [Chthoniobacteraceae bacterium]
MLISKIFHLHQPLIEASRRLREPEVWQEMAGDAEMRVSMTDGIGHFEFRSKMGEPIRADIQELPGEDPHQIVFRSVGGDIELAGMIELFEIREHLTEAVVTLDYSAVSKLQKAFGVLDRFLNRLVGRLESCIEGRGQYSGRYA